MKIATQCFISDAPPVQSFRSRGVWCRPACTIACLACSFRCRYGSHHRCYTFPERGHETTSHSTVHHVSKKENVDGYCRRPAISPRERKCRPRDVEARGTP